jgi:DNA-binding response OmpR family regulator
MKILIVEDEQHIADGLRFNLEADGYEAEIAHDGETALEMLKDSTYDAIVLDVMLPGIDGFTVAKTLREQKNFTPILMLTARSRPEDVLKGFEAGTDDYLPKPFDLEIFVARLKGLLRRQEWSRERSESETPTRLRHSNLTARRSTSIISSSSAATV